MNHTSLKSLVSTDFFKTCECCCEPSRYFCSRCKTACCVFHDCESVTQVYRHCLNDAIRVNSLRDYMYDGVQVYTSNGYPVVFIRSKRSKGYGFMRHTGRCRCGCGLTGEWQYCSLECKITMPQASRGFRKAFVPQQTPVF